MCGVRTSSEDEPGVLAKRCQPALAQPKSAKPATEGDDTRRSAWVHSVRVAAAVCVARARLCFGGALNTGWRFQ